MWHHNDTPLGHGLAAPFRNALLVAVVLALPGAAAAQSVQAVVDASKSQYQPGETLRIAVSLASPGVPALADVFVVLQLPGSTQVVSLGLGTAPVFGTLTALQGLVPAARGVNLAGAFSVGVDPFFTYAFTGGEPLGPYVLHMAVVRAGALADGQIGAGEMLAYATDGFTLERPLVEVLQPAARSEVIIAPQGGDVQTTAANGTGITLTMPPGALAEEAAIAITPVTTIANLPVSGTLLAAVRLEPDGLQLAQPATLTLTLPAGAATSGMVGFLYSGDGQNFSVLPVTVNGNTATLQVSHFSTAGLASGTEADFIAQVTPLVDALPLNLPVTQVEGLAAQLVAWVDRFGIELCDASKPAARALCQSVYGKGVASIAGNLLATCNQVAASVQANQPFTAFETLRPLMRLVSRMAELNQLAAELGLISVTPGAPELSCLITSLQAIIPPAETEGRTNLLAVIADNPPIPRMDAALQLLQNLGGTAASAGSNTVRDQASAAIARLMNELLPQASALCATEVFRADALLFRPIQLLGIGFLNALGPALGDRFDVAASGCRVTVTPNGASVPPGGQLQFSAAVADPEGIPADFVWQLDPACDGSVSATGLFTAGPASETCQLTAAAPVGGPLTTRRTFFKTVPVVTQSSVTVTARSIRATKNLRAGTNAAAFTAGPFTVIQPRTEAFVTAQTLSAKPVDPLPGTASVSESRIVLDAPAAQDNRVITGTATLQASVDQDADATVSLASSLTATIAGSFNCMLQVTTSGSGPSAAQVRLLRGGTVVFDASTSGTLTSVCGPGTYVLTADAETQLILDGSSSRTLSYTLTFTPPAVP
jgi:hypothetical protein